MIGVVVLTVVLGLICGVLIVTHSISWERGYLRGAGHAEAQYERRVWGRYADEPFRCHAVPLSPIVTREQPN